MKKLSVFFALFLLMITTAAFGGPPLKGPINLVGTWSVTKHTVNSEGYSTTIGELDFVITDQQGELFRGYAVPQDPPYTNFYGAILGQEIYMTFHDSVVSGTVDRKGTEISFIAHGITYNPPELPQTVFGTAIKD